jgi:hypothetical protein
MEEIRLLKACGPHTLCHVEKQVWAYIILNTDFSSMGASRGTGGSDILDDDNHNVVDHVPVNME